MLKNTPEPRAWVTKATAAKRMQVSERTIENYIKAGYIKAYRFGPHLIRIDWDEVEAGLTEVKGV